MSHIIVHRIDQLAQRALTRAWREASRPGPGPRADTNLWQMTRQPAVHARYPRMMSRTVGKGTAVQQMLRDDPALAGRIQEQFPDLDLAELMISPELPSEVADAVQTNVATYDPNTPDEAQLALYKPSGVTRLLSALGSDQTGTLSPDHISYMGQSALAPVIIRGVSWVLPFIPTGAREMVVEILGMGVVYTTRNFDAEGQTLGNAGSLAVWVLSGVVQPIVTIYFDTTQGGIPHSVAAYAIVEPLIQIG